MHVAGGDESNARMSCHHGGKLARIAQILPVHMPDPGVEWRVVQEQQRRPLRRSGQRCIEPLQRWQLQFAVRFPVDEPSSKEKHPVSATATGGVFTWKDGRENPDNVTVSLTYPKGFLYTYSTTFSNSYRSFSRIQGRNGTIENYGGEGASLFLVTKEGGPQEFDPEDNAHPRYTAPPGRPQ